MKLVAWLPFLFFAVLGFVLRHTHGHYYPEQIILVAALFLATGPSLLKGLAPFASRHFPLARDLLAFFFSCAVILSPPLLYAQSGAAWSVLIGLLALQLGLCVAILGRRPRVQSWAVPASVAVALLGKAFVLWATPLPGIDTFTVTQEAARFLWQGLNPYTQTYTDIYAGGMGYEIVFPYWPPVLWLAAAVRAFSEDPRWGYLLCDVVIVLAALWARGRQLSTWTWLRLWFLFPVQLFVFEQAWVDPVLMATFVVALVAMEKKHLLITGLALGLFAASKLYAWPVALLAVIALWRGWDFRPALKIAALALAVMLLCFAPFLAWDASAFLKRTLWDVLAYPPRLDSFSLYAVLARRGVDAGLFFLAVFSGAFVCSVCAVWKRRAFSASHLCACAAWALGILFLGAKQSFCNYYALLAFFLWLSFFTAASGQSSSSELPARDLLRP